MISSEKKKQIVAEFGRDANDRFTGSTDRDPYSKD